MEIEDIVLSAEDWQEDIQELRDIASGFLNTDTYSDVSDMKDAIDYEIRQGYVD